MGTVFQPQRKLDARQPFAHPHLFFEYPSDFRGQIQSPLSALDEVALESGGCRPFRSGPRIASRQVGN
jgi:hypothetical protein